jgi:hypothetical protein
MVEVGLFQSQIQSPDKNFLKPLCRLYIILYHLYSGNILLIHDVVQDPRPQYIAKDELRST